MDAPRHEHLEASADSSSWEPLGSTVPEELGPSRVALHRAVQLVASFAQAVLERREDDSHRSMRWHHPTGAFRSQESEDGLMVALPVREFTLELRRRGRVVHSTDLNARTPADALARLESVVELSRGKESQRLAWPEYEIPGGGIAPDSPLEPNRAHLDELARWYHDADRLLVALASRRPEASEVLCWPHHFDHATLLSYEASAGEDGEVRSIGVGFSPGDTPEHLPYLYVNGWPRPSSAELPEVPGAGRWHTEGWTGRALDALVLVGPPEGAAQEALATEFIENAVATMEELLKI